MTRLKEGHSTRLAFALAPALKMYETEVTPPPLDAGGAIDTTTMLNEVWRTKSPKALVDTGECVATVSYDPAVYGEVESTVLRTNGLITITFPDDSTLVFWGWIDKFAPASHVTGEMPTAEITIILSNENDSGVETGPVYAA